MTDRFDITLGLDGTNGVDGVRKQIIGFLEARAKVHDLRYSNSNAKHEARRSFVQIAEELRYVAKVLHAAEVTSENKRENTPLELLRQLETAICNFTDDMPQAVFHQMARDNNDKMTELLAALVMTRVFLDGIKK